MEAKQKPIGAEKIYPNHVDQSASEEKQQNAAPMAMAELEIMKVEAAKSVADKSPEIRNIALLLAAVVGVNLFSQIISYLIVASFDNTQSNFFSMFVSSNGALGIIFLLVQVAAIFTLLFTKNTSHAKTVILIAGIGFGLGLVSSIASFNIGPGIMTNIATLVVSFLIFRKILKVYLEL